MGYNCPAQANTGLEWASAEYHFARQAILKYSVALCMEGKHVAKANVGQGCLYEEDFLLRTLGAIANTPEVALTELEE